MDLQIPMSVDVLGVPFRIFGSQLCEKRDADDIERLEFGTRLVASDVVCKSFQFENQSPVEIHGEFSVDGEGGEFIITPSELKCLPFQNKIVKVEFKSGSEGVFTCLANCMVSYTQQVNITSLILGNCDKFNTNVGSVISSILCA
jgi:hypothetical protein